MKELALVQIEGNFPIDAVLKDYIVRVDIYNTESAEYVQVFDVFIAIIDLVDV
jgi:hypothetical protein